MTYISKQSLQGSQIDRPYFNKAVTQHFSDRRASTNVQLKQQQMMHSAHSPSVIPQLSAEDEPLQGEFEADVMSDNGLMPTTQLKPEFTASNILHGNKVAQLHHNLPLDDDTDARAHIYHVIEKKTGKVVYVGQTCDQVGIDKRFDQHLNSGYHNDWSYKTHEIKAIWSSVMTQFETTTSEQFYIDAQGGIGNLDNAVNALTQSTFDKYVDGEGNPRWGTKWRPK